MNPFALFSIIPGLINAGQQGTANAIALMNMRKQNQLADEQLRMGQASRTDAYGNTVSYNPASNRWETVLSPMQQALLNAQQSEQAKQLGPDAQRNRQALERVARTAKQSVAPFETALSGLRYDLPPSQGATEARLAHLIGQASQDQARQQGDQISTQLIREGRGALLPAVLRHVAQNIANQTGPTLLQAHEQAIPQSAQLEQAHQSKYLPALQYYGSLIGQGGGAPVSFSDLPKTLSSALDKMQQIAAYSANSAGSIANNANAAALKTLSQNLISPNAFSGLASLGKLFQPSTGVNTDTSGRVSTGSPNAIVAPSDVWTNGTSAFNTYGFDPYNGTF